MSVVLPCAEAWAWRCTSLVTMPCSFFVARCCSRPSLLSRSVNCVDLPATRLIDVCHSGVNCGLATVDAPCAPPLPAPLVPCSSFAAPPATTLPPSPSTEPPTAAAGAGAGACAGCPSGVVACACAVAVLVVAFFFLRC